MRKLTIISFILLLLTNVIVLAGVAYNRNVDNDTGIVLTERELRSEWSYTDFDENSGVSLSLFWNVLDTKKSEAYFYNLGARTGWLNEEKLKELGVDTEFLREHKKRGLDEYDRFLLSKEVIYVLEYNGDSYKKQLEYAEEKVRRVEDEMKKSPDDKKLLKKKERVDKWLKQLQVAESRLYIIDVGIEQDALSNKYSDKSKYMLMRGELRPYWFGDELKGEIVKLFISRIHVPLPYSEIIPEATRERGFHLYETAPIEPRYRIELKMGNRLEPWVGSVNTL